MLEEVRSSRKARDAGPAECGPLARASPGSAASASIPDPTAPGVRGETPYRPPRRGLLQPRGGEDRRLRRAVPGGGSRRGDRLDPRREDRRGGPRVRTGGPGGRDDEGSAPGAPGRAPDRDRSDGRTAPGGVEGDDPRGDRGRDRRRFR